jgi:hypothetical protein
MSENNQHYKIHDKLRPMFVGNICCFVYDPPKPMYKIVEISENFVIAVKINSDVFSFEAIPKGRIISLEIAYNLQKAGEDLHQKLITAIEKKVGKNIV